MSGFFGFSGLNFVMLVMNIDSMLLLVDDLE